MSDVYQKWLGIPSDQRPIDHFRLLGLKQGTNDEATILQGFRRQLKRLRPHEEGPQAAECSLVKQELFEARDILLNPTARKAYLATLSPTEKPEEIMEAEIVDDDAAADSAEEEVEESFEQEAEKEEEEKQKLPRRQKEKPPARKKTRSKAKPSEEKEPARTNKVLIGGIVAGVLALGGGLTYWFTRTAPPSSSTVAVAPQQPTPIQPQNPAPPTNPTPVVPPPSQPKPEPPPPPPQPSPVVESPKPSPTPPAAALARPAPPKPPARVQKLAVPDTSAQTAAEKLIKQQYKELYARTKPEEQLQMAARFLQPGRENRGDTGQWFVLLREARDAAARAGRPRLAVEAIDEIDHWFQIDAFDLKVQVLNRIADEADETVSRRVMKCALDQVEEAILASAPAAGKQLLDVSDKAAKKAKPEDRLKNLHEKRLRDLEDLQKALPAVAAGREKLKGTPEDPEANRVVGNHLCLFEGRWDDGLPFLARGGAVKLAQIAQQDLKPPLDVKAQIAVGDAWWEQVQDYSGRQKQHLLERAVAWYDLAIPPLMGDEQAKLIERVIEARALLAPANKRLVLGSFHGRNLEDRTLLLREGGGTMRSEEAVELGLEWLAKHQFPDGSWRTDAFSIAGRCACKDPGKEHTVAGTALALLPFLGIGETHLQGRHAKRIKLGLSFLLSKQQPNGSFHDNAYENALASLTICEAYGLSKDKPLLLLPAQAAVNFIVGAQSSDGSWGYTPLTKGDTSVSGWQFSAIKAGYYAGLSIPAATLARFSTYLDSVADPGGNGYGYKEPGTTKTTSATGLFCRQYYGWGPRHPLQARGIAHLLLPENIVTEDAPAPYFLYYATQMMHHAGGEAWETWNSRARELLINLQDQGKEKTLEHQKGSWPAIGDDYVKEGGRIMSTALALLALEAYYYHVPLNGYGPAVRRD